MPNRNPPNPDFTERTYIMGVLNVTPDSFSDGGRFFDKGKAVEHAIDMARDGGDIVDIGGESTRPGASDVSAEEELDRVMPVLEAVSKAVDIRISIDTRKPKVAEEAVRAGASIVNDVSALRHDSKMASIVAKYGVWLIIMHMRGTPKDMQLNPIYDDLINEVILNLKESVDIAKRAGVRKDRVIIDPGIGFGKTVKHNLEILNRLDEFKVLGRPICIGTSRKSFIGKVLDLPNSDDRLAGSIATHVVSIMKGANILRVHDVKEAAQAARMADSILKEALV